MEGGMDDGRSLANLGASWKGGNEGGNEDARPSTGWDNDFERIGTGLEVMLVSIDKTGT